MISPCQDRFPLPEASCASYQKRKYSTERKWEESWLYSDANFLKSFLLSLELSPFSCSATSSTDWDWDCSLMLLSFLFVSSLSSSSSSPSLSSSLLDASSVSICSSICFDYLSGSSNVWTSLSSTGVLSLSSSSLFDGISSCVRMRMRMRMWMWMWMWMHHVDGTFVGSNNEAAKRRISTMLSWDHVTSSMIATNTSSNALDYSSLISGELDKSTVVPLMYHIDMVTYRRYVISHIR
jgi:hypothetical protein